MRLREGHREFKVSKPVHHTIAKLLGHEDLRMTQRYSHLNVDSLKEAVAKLGHVLVTVGESKAVGSALSP